MPLWTSVGEAPDHTSPTRNALPSPHLDLLREMSDTTGHRVVMETCAVASRAFREHHLNVWAFEVGLVNILLSCFILGASAAHFLLYALVQTPFLFYLVYRSWMVASSTLLKCAGSTISLDGSGWPANSGRLTMCLVADFTQLYRTVTGRNGSQLFDANVPEASSFSRMDLFCFSPRAGAPWSFMTCKRWSRCSSTSSRLWCRGSSVGVPMR